MYTFSSNTESIVISQMSCCSDYSYQVMARTAAGVGVPSQVMTFRTAAQFNGIKNWYSYRLIAPSILADVYRTSISTDANSIRVSWRTSSPILQQQLRMVEVVVTSECPTGAVAPQTQTFTIMPDEGNSITITDLGNTSKLEMLTVTMNSSIDSMVAYYHVYASAQICEVTFQLYNDTVIIQRGIMAAISTYKKLIIITIFLCS